MTDEEIVRQVYALQHALKSGQMTNTEAVQRIALTVLQVQGVHRPTAEQIHELMPHVERAVRFMGENPTPEEVDAASSFIPPVGDE